MQSWVRHISVLKPFIVNRTVECSVEKWPCRRLIEISTFNVHAQSLSHVQLLGHLMDCSPPGSSVHGIFQARILEWVAISFSRGSSQPRDQTCVSQIGRPILYHWATREAQIEVHNLFSSVQSFSRVSLFVTPWTAARQTSLSIINSQSLLKLLSVELVMPSNHLILCRPLLLLPLIVPSIRVFPNESVLCIRWPKYWSFNFSISPFNEYSGLISFRMEWLDLLAVQGTFKSLLQQFKSIDFLALSFLHSPTLTSIHDHWKNQSLYQTDLCWQSNVSAF